MGLGGHNGCVLLGRVNDLENILVGGAGLDDLRAGGGNDSLLSRDNGTVDSVTCGDGVDTVTADAVDAVSSDCEQNDNGVAPAPAPPPGGSALPALSISNAKVKEGNRGTKGMKFFVQLTAPSTQPVTVRFKTQKGTAKPRRDFVGRSILLTFAPGQTELPVLVKIRATCSTSATRSSRCYSRMPSGRRFSTARAWARSATTTRPLRARA